MGLKINLRGASSDWLLRISVIKTWEASCKAVSQRKRRNDLSFIVIGCLVEFKSVCIDLLG